MSKQMAITETTTRSNSPITYHGLLLGQALVSTGRGYSRQGVCPNGNVWSCPMYDMRAARPYSLRLHALPRPLDRKDR